jgi:hypothetical protein
VKPMGSLFYHDTSSSRFNTLWIIIYSFLGIIARAIMQLSRFIKFYVDLFPKNIHQKLSYASLFPCAHHPTGTFSILGSGVIRIFNI